MSTKRRKGDRHKGKRVTVFLDHGLVVDVRSWATQEGRNLSSAVEWLLRNAVVAFPARQVVGGAPKAADSEAVAS